MSNSIFYLRILDTPTKFNKNNVNYLIFEIEKSGNNLNSVSEEKDTNFNIQKIILIDIIFSF